MKLGIIYKATSPSGKCYIGKTTQELNRRWYDHCRDAQRGRNTLIAKAISKYGKDAFSLEVLEISFLDIIDNREMFWIATLGTLSPNGYNLTTGGEGGKWSKIARIRNSGENNHAYGKSRPDFSKYVSERNRTWVGEKHPSYGKKRSDYSEILKERNKRMVGKNHPSYGKKGYWAGKKRPDHAERLRGKKQSKETRKKRSKSLMGNQNAKKKG